MHEAFERVYGQQSAQQRALGFRLERLAVDAALNSLAQPVALAVACDVLALVSHRAGVNVAQVGERLGEVFAGNVDPQQL